MEGRPSRELSAHSSATKLKQIRGVRQVERWMSHQVYLSKIGCNEFLAWWALRGTYSALWLMEWMDGWMT